MQIRYIITILISLFILGTAVDADAQRRSSRSSKSSERSSSRDRGEEKTTFKDKLAYDIFVTPFFNGGFAVSSRFGVGYKVVDPLTVGIGAKLNYTFQNSIGTGNDFSQFNRGLYPYLRYKIAEQYYAKVEYNWYTVDLGDPNADKLNVQFPMIGGGYVQGFGKWKFGAEIMIIVPDSELDDPRFSGLETSDVYPFIEYNISFLYNF